MLVGSDGVRQSKVQHVKRCGGPFAEVDMCLNGRMIVTVVKPRRQAARVVVPTSGLSKKAEIVLIVLTKQVTAAVVCRRHGTTRNDACGLGRR
jgi:hypothetical protein